MQRQGQVAEFLRAADGGAESLDQRMFRRAGRGARHQAERGERLLADVEPAFGVERQIARHVEPTVQGAAAVRGVVARIGEIVGVAALQRAVQIASRPVGLQRQARFAGLEGRALLRAGRQGGVRGPARVLFHIGRQFEIADADPHGIERLVVDRRCGAEAAGSGSRRSSARASRRRRDRPGRRAGRAVGRRDRRAATAGTSALPWGAVSSSGSQGSLRRARMGRGSLRPAFAMGLASAPVSSRRPSASVAGLLREARTPSKRKRPAPARPKRCVELGQARKGATAQSLLSRARAPGGAVVSRVRPVWLIPS